MNTEELDLKIKQYETTTAPTPVKPPRPTLRKRLHALAERVVEQIENPDSSVVLTVLLVSSLAIVAGMSLGQS